MICALFVFEVGFSFFFFFSGKYRRFSCYNFSLTNSAAGIVFGQHPSDSLGDLWRAKNRCLRSSVIRVLLMLAGWLAGVRAKMLECAWMIYWLTCLAENRSFPVRWRGDMKTKERYAWIVSSLFRTWMCVSVCHWLGRVVTLAEGWFANLILAWNAVFKVHWSQSFFSCFFSFVLILWSQYKIKF